ncbi:nuclear pore complex protein nup35 [Anaeramoeba flamelloides]|uniref:Nuclear pore complex protein nup35 n=1 Tax=Anaeramoeba flamelloides TaxID=1746091 RepID=A0AAV8A0A5_9EUKA|nr:nuclear pore complex protein nup35 [Anaeramoeba flamelloides]
MSNYSRHRTRRTSGRVRTPRAYTPSSPVASPNNTGIPYFMMSSTSKSTRSYQNSLKKRVRKNKNIKQKGRSTRKPKSSTSFGKMLHDSNKQEFFQLPPNRSQYDLDGNFDFQQKSILKLPNSRNEKKLKKKKRGLFLLPNEQPLFQGKEFSSDENSSSNEEVKILKKGSRKKMPRNKQGISKENIKTPPELSRSSDSDESGESEDVELLQKRNNNPKLDTSSKSKIEKESKSKSKSNPLSENKKNYLETKESSKSKSNKKMEKPKEKKSRKWVTLMGLEKKEKNLVLRKLKKDGYQVDKINNELGCNWVHIRLHTEGQAKKLIKSSYIELFKGYIVAIIPYAAEQIKTNVSSRKRQTNSKQFTNENEDYNNNNNNNNKNKNGNKYSSVSSLTKSKQNQKRKRLNKNNGQLSLNLKNDDLLDSSDDDDDLKNDNQIITPIKHFSSSDQKSSNSNNSKNGVLPKRNDGLWNTFSKFIWGD